jgi:RNA polymerase sigma-70 factor (ECF subfamily)
VTGEPSDRDLVRRAQRGDLDAFNRLVTRHQDKIFNAVFRFCGNYEDACDITQRAFINAFRKVAEFEGDSAFTTWMYRIAFNQSVSFRRETGRQRSVSLFGKDDEMVVEPAVPPAHDERMESQENQRKVQQALNQLDDDDRRIIVLKDLEDRSYDDIAAILDIPKGTVRSRLHRARLALKEKLKASMTPAK